MRSQISEALEDVQSRIEVAALRAKRNPEEVHLVLVTKGRSPDEVRAVHSLGVRDIGENRVEEALPKQEELADVSDLRWHMIGHIQSRKARQVAPRFAMVHSLDRMKIARGLHRHAAESGRVLPVLLECNVSGEAGKWGWALDDPDKWPGVLNEFNDVLELDHLDVKGLMTMAPWTEDTALLRSVFRRLRELLLFCNSRLGTRWNELSMGMTDDFEIAVEEGATILRIGRAVFGERPGG